MQKSKGIVSLLISIIIIAGFATMALADTFIVPEGVTQVTIPVWLTTKNGAVAGVQFYIESIPAFDSVKLELSKDVKSAALTPVKKRDDGKNYMGFFGVNNTSVPGAEMSLYLGNLIFDYKGSEKRTINISDVKIVRLVPVPGQEKRTTQAEEYKNIVTHYIERMSANASGGTGGGGTGGGGTGGGGGTTFTTGPVQIGDMSIPFSGSTSIRYAPFINGFPDGTVQPDGPVTRSQFAQILYNLFANGEKNLPSTYTDVQTSQWFYDAVAYCQKSGFMIGYPDGSFMPEQRLTRAELSTAIARLKELPIEGVTHPFPDVGNHWGRAYISGMYTAGFIAGYPDGTFQPDNDITRAEAVTIICRAESRNQTLYDKKKTFTDLSASHWAYDYVMNAANGYNYN